MIGELNVTNAIEQRHARPSWRNRNGLGAGPAGRRPGKPESIYFQ